MVPKLGFLGAKNSNLNFWRENEESNSLVFLGHFRGFGVLCMPIPLQQGSDLIDLRLTRREMENLIFWVIFEVFGDILEDFWKNF